MLPEPEFLERRSKSHIINPLSTEESNILTLISQIQNNQEILNDKLNKHINLETHELAEAITSLMKGAFPDGDPEGHRRRHELELEQLKERVEFWKKMRLSLAQWGLLGFIGWAGVALWNTFLMGPHK